MLYYWEPPTLNKRIPAQHSLFIFGTPEISKEYYREIIIPASSKHLIRSELKNIYNLSDMTLFNDIYGFAKANNSTSPIDDYSDLEFGI